MVNTENDFLYLSKDSYFSKYMNVKGIDRIYHTRHEIWYLAVTVLRISNALNAVSQ